MSKGYFITGTDTGVGKTFVTTLLARSFKGDGFSVGVMKPVETGCARTDNGLLAADALALKEAAASNEDIELLCPYRFPEPLAPNVAAKLAATEIEIRTIKENYDCLAKDHDVMLVEGAGGLLVPINDNEDMADIARALDLPIIIVAASKLGVINHTLLTLSAAFKRELQIAGIIINHTTKDCDDSYKYNATEIRRLAGSVPVLGELPFIIDKTSIPPASSLLELSPLYDHKR
jgi:dethiobiotin synthetase